MRNFINSSLKKKMQNYLLMVICFFATMDLTAQVSVTIDVPVDGTQYCAELETTPVVFSATAMDGTDVVSGANITWNWAGPNGWTSTERNPEITFNDIVFDGDYMVTATFASTETASDTISITVENTFEMTCPETITVTPDTEDDNCIKSFLFDGFQIDAVNCASLAYTWDMTLFLDSGQSFDAENFPTTTDISNSAVDAIYGMGILYDTLPFGFHTLQIDLETGSGSGITGPIFQCLVDVEVIESRNNLACNDLINLTLNNNCEALVTPDMILQGDYCFNLFGIAVENQETGVITDGIGELTLDAPGMYTATVTGQTGLSCWGEILAEDKSVPILDCEDVEMYCSEIGSINPGQSIRGFDRGRTLEAENVVVGTETTLPIQYDLSAVSGTISNVILNFEAQVDSVKYLDLVLESPAGTQQILLNLDTSALTTLCDGSNINICLSDDGELTYAMFGSAIHCRETQNAYIGSFRPLESLSAFNNESADNDGAGSVWTLYVTNNSPVGDLTVIDIDLQVYTVEGNLLGPSDVVQNAGCSDGQSVFFTDEQVGTNCENGFWEIITRTWTVTNEASGLSSECTQQISLRQWTLNEIIWPKSYDDLDQESLQCDDLLASDYDSNGVPTPEFAGYPTVPYGDICGNFEVTFDDLTFDICGPVSKKTIRTWSVLDWCTGEIVQYEQTIKVLDREPIVFSCVPDNLTQQDAEAIGYDMTTESYITGSNPYSCNGDWDVVYPLVFDNACDDSLTVEVFYLLDDDDDPTVPPTNGAYTQANVVDENGVQVNNPSSTGIAATIRDIPVGRRAWIRFVATDECNNTGECFTEVDVVDTTDPNPVCIEFTVVTIGEDGCGLLPAESLDNGSLDNCEVVDYKVRGTTGGFVDTLKIDCRCDNPNRMVTLQVADAAGNTNICIVEVEIQDNLPAVPGDMPQNLYEYDCGESPVDISAIIDTSKTLFTWFDNCFADNSNSNGQLNLRVEVQNESQAKEPFEFSGCGTGSRTVRYEVYDRDCDELLGTFNQRFTFSNSSIVDPSIFDVIRWPQEVVEINNCTTLDGLEPENLSSNQNADAINVRTGECNDIAIGWDDVYFPDVEDACLKIVRTWTVIDWCIADRFGLAVGSESFDQIIKVDDTEAPDIDVVPTFTMDSNSTTCFTQTDTTALVAIITDACTDMFPTQEVTYSHQIMYPDGTQSALFTNDDDANGAYPFGTSVITWYAEDHCGNIMETTTNVVIRDVKAPTPYCLGSAVTATMSNDGTADIWASDFDLGGFDNYTGNADCNNFEQLEIYFLDGNTKTLSMSFDCDDLPNGVSQSIPLEIYYEDEAGNRDFCIVTLILQDNQSDQCEDSPGSRIEGSVYTEQNEMLENVRVEVAVQNGEMFAFTMTDNNGNFGFDAVTNARNYNVVAKKNDNPLNGVSTLDLVMIQRHILGLQRFDSPWKMIAADADDNGDVSALDLLNIRKLILGITEEFPNGQQSWRFPDGNQTFINPNDPFPYYDGVEVYNLAEDMSGLDMMAIKIGDVNESVQPNLNNKNNVQTRKGGLVLEMNDEALFDGQTVKVPVYAKNMNDILGFQNTLNFDNETLTFIGVQSGAIEINDSNVGMMNADKGMLSLSWNDVKAVTSEENEVLFTLEFDVTSSAQLSEVLYSGSNVTNAESYNGSLEVLDMTINFRGQNSDELVLYQNVPNPFLEATDIRFSLPGSSKVVFSVYDVNGRSIYQSTTSYTAGNHTIELKKNDLQASGLMYYKIETDYGTASKKMIQIR